MRTISLTLAAAAVLGAATLRAQTSTDASGVYIPPPPAQAPADSSPPMAVPPPPPPPGPYYGGGGYGPGPSGTRLVGDISFPYAFNWNALGVSGELGALIDGHHFLGGEVTYYGGDRETYDVYHGSTYLGHFRSEQDITTLDFAYKYVTPLWDYGRRAPVNFYIGGSAGAAFVTYSNSGGVYGFYNDNNADFTAEFVAGFELNAGPAALRLGYRYVGVNHAWEFDRRTNLDSSVFEAGLTLRF